MRSGQATFPSPAPTQMAQSTTLVLMATTMAPGKAAFSPFCFALFVVLCAVLDHFGIQEFFVLR